MLQISVKEAISRELISPKTPAVYDFQFIKALEKIPWAEWVNTPDGFRIRTQFLEKFDSWIHQSQCNKITGLKDFPVHHLINGTTQTFDESYHMHANKRLRFFRGEYAYHRRVVANWKFIEDAPLTANDYIIISAPFCSTGDVHSEMYKLFNEAQALEVPVIIDCAYFGTSMDFELDVTHPCIESVSFSLSKGLGLGDIRSGIRYSRSNKVSPISQQNDYNHSVLCAAKIGLFMMDEFTADHIPLKFRTAQLEVCQHFEIEPTNVMHLALADESWSEFRIDDKYNRLGIRNLVKIHFQGRL